MEYELEQEYEIWNDMGDDLDDRDAESYEDDHYDTLWEDKF